MSRSETAHPRAAAPDRTEWDDTARSWPPGWRHPSDPHGFPPVRAYAAEADDTQPGGAYGFDPFADDERLSMSEAEPLESDPMAWRAPEANHPQRSSAAARVRGTVPLTDALTAETIEAPLFAAAAARPYGEPVAGAVRLPQVFVPRPRTGGGSVSDPLHPDWRGDDHDADTPLAEPPAWWPAATGRAAAPSAGDVVTGGRYDDAPVRDGAAYAPITERPPPDDFVARPLFGRTVPRLSEIVRAGGESVAPDFTHETQAPYDDESTASEPSSEIAMPDGVS